MASSGDKSGSVSSGSSGLAQVWRSCRVSWSRPRDALVPLMATVELARVALLSRAVPGS